MLGKIGMAALLWLAQMAVQAADLPGYPFVHVSGSGMVFAMADVGEVEFEVHAADADPARARAIVEERLAAIRALLATYAVPEGDVTIRDVRRDMPKGEAPEQLHRLKCSVRIKVAVLASWAQIVAPLLDMPNLDDFAVAFDVTDRARLESELTQQALKDARKKAGDIAAGVGRRLGPASGVSEGEIKNLSRSMGLVAVDFPRHAPARDATADRDALLTISVIRLGKSVDVLYSMK